MFRYKISMPVAETDGLLHRARLVQRIQQALPRGHVLLVAPAGYGKTALVLDTLARHPGPVCWYSLDATDRDPRTWIEYLTASIQTVRPDAMRATRCMLADPSVTVPDPAVLLHDLDAIMDDLLLVLDDWHQVDGSDITPFVAGILQHCPHIHLVLTSRWEPTIPGLALLQGRRKLGILTEDDLQVTPDEVAALLGQQARVHLTPDAVADLTRRTGGWITGILLQVQARGTLQEQLRHPDPAHDPAITGFLATEVWAQQPADIGTMLLETALLEVLSMSDLTAQLGYAPDQAIRLLTHVREHHLATVRAPGVLHYPEFLRTFLCAHGRRVAPERMQAREQALIAGAMAARQWQRALTYALAAADMAATAAVLRAGGADLYAAGRLTTLAEVLAQLPEVQYDPDLWCLRARVALTMGRLHAAEQALAQAQGRQDAGSRYDLQSIAARIAHMQGRYADSVARAQVALTSATTPGDRAEALRIIAAGYHRQQQPAAALPYLEAALRHVVAQEDPAGVAQLLHDLGMCHKSLGLGETALAYYAQAAAAWERVGNRGGLAMVLNSRGVLEHLRGDWHAAQASLQAALAHAMAAGRQAGQAAIQVSLGDLARDAGRWSAAAAHYTQAQHLGGSALVQRDAWAGRVLLLLLQGQAAAAARLLDAADAADGMVPLLRALLAYRQDDRATADARVRDLQAADLPIVAQIRLGVLAGACAQARTGQALATTAGYAQAQARAAQHGYAGVLWATVTGWPRTGPRPAQPGDDRPVLQIQTLGLHDTIRVDGRVILARNQRVRELGYLLVLRPEGLTTDALADLLYPEATDIDRVPARVRRLVMRLRQALPDGSIDHGERGYCLNRQQVKIQCDCDDLLRVGPDQVQDRDWSAVQALYPGAYLAAYTSLWVTRMQMRVEQHYLTLLHAWCAAQADPAAALVGYQRIIAIDDLDAQGHRGVIRCWQQMGQPARARQHAVRHADLLGAATDLVARQVGDAGSG